MQWPKIAIWSLFRDSAGEYLSEYRRRIDALDYPRENIRLYLGEGDSNDSTLLELTAYGIADDRVRIIKRDTGQPYLGHTTDPARMATLEITGNAVWDAITNDLWCDYGLMLESDLLFKPDLLKRLVASKPDADIVAPMIWLKYADGGGRFYDIWAFRKNGVCFPPNPPAWYAANYQSKPFIVDSAGSVLLIKEEVLLAGARFTATEAVVGMCNDARKMGFTIYCDPEIHVVHPNG